MHPAPLRYLVALLTVFIAGPSLAVDAERLDALIERGMKDWGIPGVAVSVIEDGELIHARGFGVLSVESNAPVDAHSAFVNASTTKAMVAAAVLLLVDEGRVALDDPVVKHLPTLRFADPALTPQITVRDLLTHRTGLPSTDFWSFNQGMPITEQVQRLALVAPVAPPRARRIYQNTMYELAGLVIEAAAGQPWDRFVRSRLWEPIGMNETWARRGDIPDAHPQARAHDEVQGELREIAHSLRPEVENAAGSVWSTVSDMARWAQFLLNEGVTATGERLLSEVAARELFTPQQIIAPDNFTPTEALTMPNWRSYGLGWYQQDFQGRKIDFHTGSLNGAVALLGMDRARGRAVMFMANRGGAELRHAVLWEVMDERAAEERPDWHADVLALYQDRAAKRAAAWQEIVDGRLPDVAPSLPLAAYAGRYDSARSGPLALQVDGDGLRLDTLIRTYRLTPWHADTFLLMHRDWSRGDFARFELTPAGRIEAVEVFGDRFERPDS